MTCFNSKYPIICAPMNQVSDIALAIAVHRAGAIPSLSFFNYIRQGQIDFIAYQKDLVTYKDQTGSDTLLLSIGGKFILSDKVLRPYLDLGFRHIEMFHWASEEPEWPAIRAKCNELEQRGVTIIFKTSTGHLSESLDYKTILLKGPDGAGRVIDGAMSLDEGINFCASNIPTSKLIPCGGIYSREQVSGYIDNGAVAVAIGSLFAVSKESQLADEVKLKILNSTVADLQTGGPLNHRGLFSNIIPNDSSNLTTSLQAGIKDPNNGVIFISKSIEFINEVLTVDQIVKSLV